MSELEQQKRKNYDDDIEPTQKEEMFSPTHSEEGTPEDTNTPNDPPYGSPSSSPTANLPATKKKAKVPKEQRNTTRGRPRKYPQAPPREKHRSPTQKARLSNDAKEGIEIMHQMTCEVVNMKPSTVLDASFVLTDLKSYRNKVTSVNDGFAYDAIPGASNAVHSHKNAIPGASNASHNHVVNANAAHNHVVNEVKPVIEMMNGAAPKYPKLETFIGMCCIVVVFLYY